ncbi:hypothetical protein [Streptomyces natalensis]|nr:hypothetical protein [Streptomyces natalensis]
MTENSEEVLADPVGMIVRLVSKGCDPDTPETRHGMILATG